MGVGIKKTFGDRLCRLPVKDCRAKVERCSGYRSKKP